MKTFGININTLLTSLALGVIIYVGSVAVKAKDDLTKMSTQQSHIIKTLDAAMPRVETELKLAALKVDIEAVRAQGQATDAELIKIKQMVLAQPLKMP